MFLKRIIHTFYFLIIIILLLSCNNNDNNTKVHKPKPADYGQKLINANVHLTHTEDELIEEYISRYKWDMVKTNSGLRYFIYKKGNGKSVDKKSRVKINFKTNLINGKMIYSSDNEGTKMFNIGKGEVEKGLEEGILLLKVGDKAKFIIPSHLGFGLLGDEKNIPSKATLIYDVELVEISKQLK